MKCFVVYHGVDMDGFCSGAIAYKFLKEREDIEEIVMIPMNRGWDMTPIKEIPDGSVVFVLDYSFSTEEMMELDRRTEFYWIDHHLSVIREAEEAGFDPKGKRVLGSAACELTYDFFSGEDDWDNVPHIIKMLGRYDVHDTSYEPKTLWYNIYLNNANLNPGLENYKRWEQLFAIQRDEFYISEKNFKRLELVVDDSLEHEKILEGGKFLYEFQQKQWATDAVSRAFEMVLTVTSGKEYSVLVLNGGKGSGAFEVLKPENHDILLSFHISKDRSIKYSVYAVDESKLDVSKFAVSYGGGGHPGASGFKSELLPWQLPGMRIKEKTNDNVENG